MANLRVIRKRVRSVASTQKITKAMKMVAAARLRRSQNELERSAPYALKLNELLTQLAGPATSGLHPLLKVRKVEKRALVILTSDRGLCGAFNSGLIRNVERERLGPSVSLVLIGRRGISYFNRRKTPILRNVEGFWGAFNHAKVSELARELSKNYLEGTVDQIDLVYNRFVSVMNQVPTVKTLVPIQVEVVEASKTPQYIYEPNREATVMALVPKAIETQLYNACLHSLTSEYGARMAAMDSATRNADEMIDSLTLALNRARQAQITRELVEIISGAEALN